jgi:hypothetical protein
MTRAKLLHRNTIQSARKRIHRIKCAHTITIQCDCAAPNNGGGVGRGIVIRKRQLQKRNSERRMVAFFKEGATGSEFSRLPYVFGQNSPEFPPFFPNSAQPFLIHPELLQCRRIHGI